MLGAVLVTTLPSILRAEDSWNPFREAGKAARPPVPAPPAWQPGSSALPELSARLDPHWSGSGYSAPVERGELPVIEDRSRSAEGSPSSPALPPRGSGLPGDLWLGLDIARIQDLVSGLSMPPRSPALAAVWRRFWSQGSTPPTGGRAPGHGEALAREVLYRSGFVAELAARAPMAASSATAELSYEALALRLGLAMGQTEPGCARAKDLARSPGDTAKPIRGDMLLLAGYCAALQGNRAAAGLAAELAQAEGVGPVLAVGALDAVRSGVVFTPKLPKRLSLLDYRYLQLAGVVLDTDVLIERAEPALLAALALGFLASGEGREQAMLRVRAAERAARAGIIEAGQLAIAYREAARANATGPETADAGLRRASLFTAIEAERVAAQKTRLIRSLLDEAHREGLYAVLADGLAGTIEALTPAPEIGWFAETAVEINLSAGRYAAARTWIVFASSNDPARDLRHWLALVDIADPKSSGGRGTALSSVESLSGRDRFKPGLLHRIATVLDALDHPIPVPLWEVASRTSPPISGHLPETGVLSQLQEAAKAQQVGHTVLLVHRTMGPDGADGAHMIALGDSIRALRRTGLDPDARRLALEALFAAWPRTASN